MVKCLSVFKDMTDIFFVVSRGCWGGGGGGGEDRGGGGGGGCIWTNNLSILRHIPGLSLSAYMCPVTKGWIT